MHPLALRLSAYLGALFLSLGLILPFWPVYLESKGLDPAQIGLVMAVSSWARVVGVPFWGRIADPPGRGRPTLILLALASALFYAGFFVAEGYLQALVLYLLVGFVFGAQAPLADSQILAATRPEREGERPLDYGRVRLWGSATFILGNLLGGWLIALENRDWFLLAVVLPLFATAAAAWNLPRRPRDLAPRPRESYWSLLRNRPYLALILVSCLLQASHGAYYVCSALAWRAAGHSAETVAWLWIEGVVAEILLLAWGRHLLARFRPTTLLAVGALAVIVRWSATAATDALAALIVLQALHALTFAVVHLATVTQIPRLVPPSRLASGQSLLAAIQAGLFVSLSVALAGWLYEAGGAPWAFGAMAGLGFVGLLAIWLLRRLLAPQTVP